MRIGTRPRQLFERSRERARHDDIALQIPLAERARVSLEYAGSSTVLTSKSKTPVDSISPFPLRSASVRDTICIYVMRFEWDEEKNLTNQRKHGFSFDAAARIFTDPRCLILPDRIDDETGEQRWHAIGTAEGIPALLLVAHVYRSSHGEEIIRIITARQADRKDAGRYHEQAFE